MNESEGHFRVTMFFPLRDNDGNAFEAKTWGGGVMNSQIFSQGLRTWAL